MALNPPCCHCEEAPQGADAAISILIASAATQLRNDRRGEQVPFCNHFRVEGIKGSELGKEDPMVMLATDSPIPTFRLVDDAGTSVGRIVLPVAERISGVGAETVFLQRDPLFGRRRSAGSADVANPLAGH
jgi:hypothetical protein